MTADGAEFARRLRAETGWLRDWLFTASDNDVPPALSLGVTVSLVDRPGRPVAPPAGGAVGASAAAAPWAVTLELEPVALSGRPFSAMADALGDRLARLGELVAPDATPILRGVPPGLRPEHIHCERLRLNPDAAPAALLLARLAGPERLTIGGLRLPAAGLLPVAATAGLSLRLATGRGRLVRWHNAAILTAPAAVAVAGDNPMLFGHPIGHDSRVALLEAALAGAGGGLLPRSTLGTGYGRDRLHGVFVENRQHYRALDTTVADKPMEALWHLRRHHETVLRWCRPWLVGAGAGDGLGVGVECLALSPGPGVEETVANVAFVTGAIAGLAARPAPPEAEVPFSAVLDGFRAAVADGPAARMRWGGRQWRLRELINGELLPIAAVGLEGLGVEAAEARRWLGTAAERLRE